LILAAEGTNDVAYLVASQRRTEKMKSIVSDLNKKLKPILRLTDRPQPNPMTSEEISRLETTPPKWTKQIEEDILEPKVKYQLGKKIGTWRKWSKRQRKLFT
jgi:hypothetical protein